MHAQNTQKCLRVEQPFLQLRAKFQVYISSQKVFRDMCWHTVDSWHWLFSRRRVLWAKHWKWVLCYNFTPGGRIFIKLGRNVLFDDTYAVSKPKFEIRKFSTFYRGDIVVTTNGGGCCTAHWRAWLGMIEKRIFRFFSFITRGKEKTAHIRKNFWKIFKKSLENQFFPTLRYNTPPIRTQTINTSWGQYIYNCNQSI